MTCQNPVRRALALVGAALLAFSLVAIGASPAEGQTTVTTAQQLRDAVDADAATIVLGADITLNCADGPLEIDSATTIRSSSSALRKLSVDGECRIIDVTANVSLTIERLHLSGGHAPDGENGAVAGGPSTDGGAGEPGEDGGAIRSLGSVTVVDSRFTDNVAGDGGNGAEGSNGADAVPADIDGGNGGAGGDGGNGGAIHADGSVTVTNSTFSGNKAGNGGAGGNGGDGGEGAEADPVEPGGSGGTGGDGGNGGSGGAISAGGTVTIVGSTLTANTSGEGGNGGDGGDGGTGGAAAVPDGNGSVGAPGGNSGDGGDGGSGGAVAASSLALETSTIHANGVGTPGVEGGPGTGGAGGLGNGTGNDGAGGPTGFEGDPGDPGAGGAAHTTGNTAVESSTITANTASEANAARSLSAGGDITLDHAAVAGTGPGEDCDAVNVEATNSIDGDGSCGDADTESEPDLLLGNLTDNGGPTATRLPQANSPLVDSGAATCPDDTDQRGVVRKQGTTCDIGAVERRAALDATVTYAPTDGEDRVATVGEEITVVFTLTFSGDGIISADDLEVSPINECPNPVIGGDTAPWTGGEKITYTCVVSSDEVDSYFLAFRAVFPNGEMLDDASESVFVQFLQATTTSTTTTTIVTTTPTSVPVVGSDTGSSGGGALPRTGLSILLTLTAGTALVFGGSSMSKVAKARAEKSPRWNVKYGVPYPVGTHKQRTRDDI